MSTKKSNEEKAQSINSVIDKSRSPRSQREKEVNASRGVAIKTAAAGIVVDKAVKDLAQVGLTIQTSLSSVSTELQNKLAELKQVDEAIVLRNAELEELHGKDIVAASLDTIITQYEAKKAELETQIIEAQAQWARDQKQQEADVQVAQADRVKAWNREELDHKFAVEKLHREERARYEDTLRARNLQDQEQQRQRELDWNNRETILKTREVNMEELQKKVDGIPALLKTEIGREVGMAESRLTRDYKHATELATKDHENKVKVLEGQLTAEVAKNHLLEKSNVELEKKLEAANERANTLSMEALKAASGASALSAVQASRQQQGDQNGQGRKS